MEMGKNNFVTATQLIEDLADKRNAIIAKAANIVADAVIDRAKDDNVNSSMVKDIMNLLKDFSDEDKKDIMAQVIVNLAMAGKFSVTGKTEKHSDNGGSHSSIFAARQRYQ